MPDLQQTAFTLDDLRACARDFPLEPTVRIAVLPEEAADGADDEANEEDE